MKVGHPAGARFEMLDSIHSMDTEDSYNLGILFYLAIEAECATCSRRFAEPEGNGEKEIHKWAEQTAAKAYQTGWRDVNGEVTCPSCISLNKPLSNSRLS